MRKNFFFLFHLENHIFFLENMNGYWILYEIKC
jgi:hypothetical protein